MEIFFAPMEIFKWVRRSPQPRSSANDIAVVLLVAPGRHQWAHNQLFASTAITYQLAEWLSGLSMGPSGLSCLSLLLRRTRRCRAKKKKNSCSIWVPRQARARSKKGSTLGRGWHCSEPTPRITTSCFNLPKGTLRLKLVFKAFLCFRGLRLGHIHTW